MIEKEAPQPTATRLFIVIGLTVLAAVVRFHAIGSQPLWLDEAFSAHKTAQPLAQVLNIGDAHPPLYYVILSFWQALGDDETTLRALSALLSVAALPFVYGLGATLGGGSLGLLAALFYALGSYQVRHAQEVRMYALFTLAASMAMWGLARILVRAETKAAAGRSAWVAYVVGTALMVWTQHTGWLFVVAANACVFVLLLCRKLHDPKVLGRWMLAQAAVLALGIPVAPWLLSSLREIEQGFWIPPVSLYRIVEVVRTVYLTPYLGTLTPVGNLVLLAAAAAGAWSWRRRPIPLAMSIALLAVPLAAEVASGLTTSILIEHSVIWTAIPFYLLVAAAVVSARPSVRAVVGAVVIVILCVDLAGYYRKYRKEAWDEAAAHVAAGVVDGDLIVYVAAWTKAPFEYYFRRYNRRVESYLFDEVPITEESLRPLAQRVTTHPKIWLVESHRRVQDPDRRVSQLLRSRCDEEERKSVYRIEVLGFEDCR